MCLPAFKIGMEDFVVIPRKRYEELCRAEEDCRDAEVAQKGRKAFLSGKMKPIPLAEARRRWGA